MLAFTLLFYSFSLCFFTYNIVSIVVIPPEDAPSFLFFQQFDSHCSSWFPVFLCRRYFWNDSISSSHNTSSDVIKCIVNITLCHIIRNFSKSCKSWPVDSVIYIAYKIVIRISVRSGLRYIFWEGVAAVQFVRNSEVLK